MKAVGYAHRGPIDTPPSLEDIEVPVPEPGPRDLRVAVHAVSVNPVDTKIRRNVEPEGGHRILGWDASGVVEAIGSAVERFAVGDAVYYAGALERPGSNAEYQLVDERIVGHKPGSLSHAEAAALPLTAITAWELLFDRFGLPFDASDAETRPGAGDALLIIGGAGGVGSMMIQLAHRFTGLTVVATASRPATTAWCETLGADHVIDHRGDLPAALAERDIFPRYVASLTATDQHFPAIAELIAPQGAFGLIDDPDPATIDIGLLKRKSVALHWEFMFTRSMFDTPDIAAQGRLLDAIAAAVDAGRLVTTLKRRLGPIDAATLREAHALQESGRALGKTVLEGF